MQDVTDVSGTGPTKLLFIHIPRTGGTTFKYILGRNYKADERHHIKHIKSFDIQLLQHPAKVIYGHMNWCPSCVRRRAFILTILRNPIDQVLSYYKHTCVNGLSRISTKTGNNVTGNYEIEDFANAFMIPFEYGVYKKFIERQPTVYDFVLHWRPRVDNIQAQFIAGVYFDGGEELYGGDDITLFKRATHNLNQTPALVGTTERFGEFVASCAKRFGWQRTGYSKLNKSGTNIELDRRTKALLEQKFAVDMALYEYVADRLAP